MGESSTRCAVCGGEERPGSGLLRVIVELRTLLLCRSHAATVMAAMPETFEELRALFVGAVPTMDSIYSGLERRSPISRRAPEDRRAFPPRPEGRRRASGRRATDMAD
ncbi:hypothetical protein [Chondromyces crocatus]|uniref:Uncharacterized protein n=1 Tax=Chondromyces crocatus TaxID=52 RepID=A0A0K1ESP9_CHOCO|nr:hypothetical protein [Chondromyces crocatus]AKT43960.1 uncharacterized protein CMC5_081970 [Chondromyces crocatus]